MIVFVGQAPGPRTNPLKPLSGVCGSRLERLAGGPIAARKMNLLPAFPGKSGKGDRFPIVEAERAAARLERTLPADAGAAALARAARVDGPRRA